MFGLYYKVWILFLVFVGAAEQAQQSRNVDAAQRLRVGMTRHEVLDVMGPPDFDYHPTWNHWLYGASIDLGTVINPSGRANPIPIRLRLFFYDQDDVVVRWGTDDKAIRIDRPVRLDVPKEFHQILDACVFAAEVFELFALPEPD